MNDKVTIKQLKLALEELIDEHQCGDAVLVIKFFENYIPFNKIAVFGKKNTAQIGVLLDSAQALLLESEMEMKSQLSREIN